MSQNLYRDRELMRHVLRRFFNKVTRVFLLVEPRDDCPPYERVCGSIVCEHCGEQYFDHASDPIEPWLTNLCDGRWVKL